MKAYIVSWVDGRHTTGIEDLGYLNFQAACEAAKAFGYEMCAECRQVALKDAEAKTANGEVVGGLGPGIINVWEEPCGSGPKYQFTIDYLYVCDVLVKEIDID